MQIGDFDFVAQQIAGAEYFSNLLFPGFVLRMGLAGVDDLQTAAPASDRFESLYIRKQKISALVRGRAPRKADRKHVHIHPRVGFEINMMEQFPFCRGMRLPNLLLGNAQRVAQAAIVLVPA